MKLLCLLGWHKWVWKLSDVGYISLSEDPPNFAKCERCGTRYRKEE
ncbi:hypothetical protein KAR91_08915 [Candidatus Pacearchaeota archaeon]|nr:hypothetical protein [Candidatus Pacearchaeota archaeon]